jgi:adenylate cyclase
MGTEIERKFLVYGTDWRKDARGVRFRQGYLCSHPERTVRVRVAGERGTLTIKGLTRGATRDEFEYDVPLADAEALLDRLCERPILEKTRYAIPYAGLEWEVDVFEGENRGLVVAEVELTREDQPLTLPPWVSKEVTDDPRYYNANLVRTPFTMWTS